MAIKSNSIIVEAKTYEYENLSELMEAMKAATEAAFAKEPEEIRGLRTGKVKVGTNQQYFTTWDFANSLIRDLSMTWYALVRTFEDSKFTLEQSSALVGRFDGATSNFLRYSGFPMMGGFAASLSKQVGKAKSREEATQAVRMFLSYLNAITAWSFHYFPWNIGSHLTYVEQGRVSSTDLSRRVHITDGVRVRLSWQPLGITVVALLATNHNPELCNDLLSAMPFTILMDHALVCGKSMYAWAPLVSTSPVHVKERQCDAPVGRLRFSQATGMKVIVQYGEVTEDIESPVLGEVLPQFAGRLAMVGAAVLKSTMESKEIITLTMELLHP